jgi:hypothetical protein
VYTSEWCLAVIRDVAAALQAAHRLGIAHRRISPTVIYVDPDQVDPHGVVARVGGWDRADLGGTGVRTRRSFFSGEGQEFVAPEVVDGTVQNQVVADVYSLARVIEWIWEELGPTAGVEPMPPGLAQLVETLGHPDPDERSAFARDVFDAASDSLSQHAPMRHGSRWDSWEPEDLISDRFRVVRRFPPGRTSIVYEVEDLFLGHGQRWALKVFRPEFSQNLDLIRREYRAVQRIDHPNVVKVTWVFVHDGHPCLLMELLGVRNLRIHLEGSGPFEQETVLEWFDGLLDALATLHRSDGGPIVHRDIKPENLIVTQEGDRLVLIDFGLADAHHVGGTVGYMRAEADPSSSDPDRDLFALAVTLHEVLTGIHPWGYERCIGPPMPDLDLPGPLLDLLMRVFNEDPQHWFGSAEEFRVALAEVRRDLDHPVSVDDLRESDVLVGDTGVRIEHVPGPTLEIVTTTPAGVPDVQVFVERARIEAGSAIRLDVELCRAENGEAWIRATHAHRSPRRFQRLLHGLRPGIRPVPEHQGFEYMELRQAQIVDDPNWPKLRRVSKEVLDEGAGVDCEGQLVALGASQLDTQEMVWGATNNRKKDLCVVFGAGNVKVPIAAYALTRVAPLIESPADP